MSTMPNYTITGVYVALPELGHGKSMELVRYALGFLHDLKIPDNATTQSIRDQIAAVLPGSHDICFVDPDTLEEMTFEHYPTLAVCLRSPRPRTRIQ